LRPHFSNMYAVVEIAGKQFKVAENQSIYVHRLAAEEGSKVSFDRVLLVENNGQTKVGTPVISGSTVEAKVISHVKGDKVLVFKKKRRKGYAVKRGHRQQFTRIHIESIKA
jgi:large subunit ribosomal protein L21